MTGARDCLIYLLEDDSDVASVFERALIADGFLVECFTEARGFLRRIRECAPDLSILDLGLPDDDGLSVLRNVLSRENVATIIVTGRGGLSDKLKGLDYGADDYIVKPVEPLELVARVRTVLRRINNGRHAPAADRAKAPPSSNLVEFAGWHVDFASLQLISPERQASTLSRSDAQLLRAFLEAQGRVLSRDFLLELCVASGEENFDRTIDVRVSRLRKKLRDNPRSPTHIRTVYGAGYVFASPARWL